jgi:hypothetical protein
MHFLLLIKPVFSLHIQAADGKGGIDAKTPK